MINLAPYQSRLWLMEPTRMHELATEICTYDTCYTPRQVAKERAKRLAAISALGGGYLCGCSEVQEPALADPGMGAKQLRAVKGKIGLIPVYSMLDQRMNSALMKAGGTSTEEIGMALDVMMKEPSVGCIVLHVDSPGGSDRGLQEVSDKIYAARQTKPVYAMVDSMMASAAYWLGTSASMVMCTPGGQMGSIGVYQLHLDQSKALEADGVKVSVIKAGKYKAEGNPFEPLDDDAREHIQDTINGLYDKFCAAVARNRGTTVSDVRSNYGEGRVLNADAALKAGMCDRVMTFDELLGRLTSGSTNTSLVTRRADAPTSEILQLRHQHRMKLSEAV